MLSLTIASLTRRKLLACVDIQHAALLSHNDTRSQLSTDPGRAHSVFMLTVEISYSSIELTCLIILCVDLNSTLVLLFNSLFGFMNFFTTCFELSFVLGA